MANPWSFLPPTPEEERPKSVVVSNNDLIAGNIEYNIGRAKNAYVEAPTRPEPLNVRDGMRQVSDDLQNESIEKDDSWWKGAVSKLDWLKYLDVPIELGAEVVEGVIPGKWGGEGTAPREDFEAWKALFGQDQGGIKERFNKASDAFEKRPLWAQLGLGVVQIGATLGAGALATGAARTGSIAAKLSSASIRAGGYAVDPAEVLFKAVGKGVGGGYKATKSFMGTKSINDFGMAGNTFMVKPNGALKLLSGVEVGGMQRMPLELTRDVAGFADPRKYTPDPEFKLSAETRGLIPPTKPVYRYTDPETGEQTPITDLLPTTSENPLLPESKFVDNPAKNIIINEEGKIIQIPEELSEFDGAYSPLNQPEPGFMDRGMAHLEMYGGGETRWHLKGSRETTVTSPTGQKTKRKVNISSPFGALREIINNPNTPWGKKGELSPVLKRGNEFRRLLGDLHNWSKETEGTERLQHLKDLAMISLQLSMASRPGVIQSATFGNLEQFGRTGRLLAVEGGKPVSLGSGERSGLMFAIDDGEAQYAVTKYLDALKEAGIKPTEHEMIFAFNFRQGMPVRNPKSADNVLNNALTYYRGVQNKSGASYNLSNTAQAVRNQVISEKWLEGISFEEIKTILGHGAENDDLVYGYILDIDRYIGDHKFGQFETTLTMERLRIFSTIFTNISPETRREILSKEDLHIEARTAARKKNNKTQRKGKYAGKAEQMEVVMEVGDAYMQSPELIDLMSPLEKSKYNDIINNTNMPLATQEVILNSMRLKALSQLGLENRVGHEDVLRKMDAISHGASSITKQGKLQRAGYKVTVEKGRIKATMIKDEWAQKKRAKYAREIGLDYTSVAQWNSWAGSLVNEHARLGNLVDEFGVVRRLDGTKMESYIPDLLADYIDTKSWEVGLQWHALPDTHKKSFASFGSDIFMMQKIGSGRGLLGNTAQDSKNYYATRAKNSKAKTATYNQLDPEFRERTPAGQEIQYYIPYGQLTEAKDYAMKLSRISTWVQEEGVSEALQFYRVSGNEKDGPRLVKKLEAMATANPNLFGANWKRVYTAEKKVKGKSKLVITSEGQEMLEELAAIMINNYSEMNISRRKHNKILTLGETLFDMEPLRLDIEGTDQMFNMVSEGHYLGISPQHLVANYDSVDDVVEGMGSSEVAKRWNDYNSGPRKLLMDVVRPLWSIASGGQGKLARDVTKPISAAGHLYRRSEEHSTQVARVVKKVNTDILGMQTAEATDQMKSAGIRAGNQWYGNLELQPVENIIEFEKRQDVIETYHRMGGNRDSKRIPTWKKITGITQNVEARRGTDVEDIFEIADGELRDPENLLRQVDVVLERIPPQYWDEYFVLTPEQKYALVWNKSILSEIDKAARARHVDIVGIIKDKGGEYLPSYVPRLMRRSKDRIMLGKRGKPIKLLNSYNSHFQQRETPDILDVLARDAKAEKLPGDITKGVLEAFDERVGLYYEVMTKEGINQETKELLLAASKDSVNTSNILKSEMKQLDNIERMLNDRLDGKLIADPARSQAMQEINDPTITSVALKHSWLTNDGGSAVLKAQNPAEYAKVMDDINVRRMEIAGELEDYGLDLETGRGMWLETVFRRLSQQDQNAVRQHLEATPPVLMKPVTKVAETIYGMTQMFRTFKAGFDLGAPMIHGYNSLVKLPWIIDGKFSDDGRAAWGKSVNVMKKVFFQPDFLDTYMINNHELRQRAGRWVMLGEAEPLGALQSQSSAMRHIKEFASDHVPAADKIKWTQRFEKSFVGFTDALRMQLFDSMEISVRRTLSETVDKATGKMLDPNDFTNPIVRKAYKDLGDSINKATGVFDQDLAGMTPLQRLMESSLLFFAPMYRRATYGIIADLVRGGGVRRREAMRQLGGIVGVGAMIGALVEATGNNDRGFVFDEEGNPDLTARFGKLNVGGYQIGIGTAWWTAFRLASDLAMMPQRDDVKIDADWNDNPILTLLGRKGRSQLAPGAGYLVDVFQGRTFTGDPLRDREGDWEGMQLLQHTGSQMLPFWADISVSGGWGVPIAGASEFFGFQSYELSEFDHLSKARNHAAMNWDDPEVVAWRMQQQREGKPINWLSLPTLLKQRIEDKEPTSRAAKENYEQTFGKVARGESALFRKYRDKKSEHDLLMIQELAIASNEFEKGNIDGRQFNQRKSRAFWARRRNSEALLNSSEYSDLLLWFAELRNSKSKQDKSFQGDILFDAWMTSVVHHPDNVDEDGQFKWASYKNKEVEFKSTYNIDDEEWDYLQDRKNYWYNELPIVNEFEDAQSQLSIYWRAHETIWKPGTKMFSIANKYFEMPQSKRNQMKRRYPVYKEIDQKVAKRREEIRQARPDLDYLLVKWYGNIPRHTSSDRKNRQDENIRWSHRRNEQEGRWDWKTPKWQDFSISPTGRVNRNPDLIVQ